MVSLLLIVTFANLGVGFLLSVFLGSRYRAIVSGHGARPWFRRRKKKGVPDSSSEPAMPDTASDPLAPKSPICEALEALQNCVGQYAVQLARTDDELRKLLAAPEASRLDSLFNSHETATRAFTEQRDAAHGRLTALLHGNDNWDELRNEVQIATQLQDSETKSTQQGMSRLTSEEDIDNGCRQVLARLHRLQTSHDLLRDTLDAALAEVTLRDNRTPGASERLDPLTNCLSRTAADAEMATWRGSSATAKSPCAALLDIDGLAQTNEKFGYETGSAVLKATARLLQSLGGSEDLIARFAGQRFLLLFPNHEVNDAVALVERGRQTIESTRFEIGGQSLRVTLSGAVTKAGRSESRSAVLTRLESALREAKRFGQNRTFVHEGKFPAPITPPELALSEQLVSL